MGGAGGELVLLSNSGGVAIPGNILLGRRCTFASTRQIGKVLRIGNPNQQQIASTSVITFAGGTGYDAGIFQLYGASQTIGAIQSQGPGDGIVENANPNTSSTLTLDDNTPTDTYSFSGLLRDGILYAQPSGGTLSLTKSGAYTQILASPNTYTGVTTLTGGV